MSVATATDVRVRRMDPSDMLAVLAIEQASFSQQPWAEEQFQSCLHRFDCVEMVAEQRGNVIGFIIYALRDEDSHLLNVAVHPARRRCGVGAQLVRKLTGTLSPRQRTRIIVEVRETNLVAQQFFRSQGFQAIRVLRNHCPDTGEDAFLMQYPVPS